MAGFEIFGRTEIDDFDRLIDVLLGEWCFLPYIADVDAHFFVALLGTKFPAAVVCILVHVQEVLDWPFTR